jgi:hypothetical protein
METAIPYLVSPGSIKTALERIRQAATPDRVSRDFMTTKLGIKGGTGYALIPYLKKIGFINADGTPSELYKQFRNPAMGGNAVASAIKTGYGRLSQVNEYFYELNDKDLQSLIVQVSGLEAASPVAKFMFSTLKTLKGFAAFDGLGAPAVQADANPGAVVNPSAKSEIVPAHSSSAHAARQGGVGLNLAYTINLNLPATADQAVFNAIFRSLKEHLLSNVE